MIRNQTERPFPRIIKKPSAYLLPFLVLDHPIHFLPEGPILIKHFSNYSRSTSLDVRTAAQKKIEKFAGKQVLKMNAALVIVFCEFSQNFLEHFFRTIFGQLLQIFEKSISFQQYLSTFQLKLFQ